MWNSANFLFEIGSEEIPAGYIPSSMENLRKIFTAKLDDARVSYERIEVYATPRRLVLLGSGIAEAQREEMIEMKGPAADRAYADGKPTQALSGFLAGNGLSEKDLVLKETPKGNYYYGYKKADSKPTREILPDMLCAAVRELPFPKKMKWGSRGIQYPRPIRYLLTLFNNEVIRFELDGIVSSNETRGHFVQHPGMITVPGISVFPELLRAADVILDQNERRAEIARQLSDAAAKAGGVLVPDDELLDVVTYLVEKPNAVVCEFNEEFLPIPDIVLITEMREHQKYFAVRDASGKLTNRFLVISNNPETSFVREGNERVIRARFTDASFFFSEDGKHTLDSRVPALKNVLFHKELGSIFDKIERMQKCASVITGALGTDAATAKNVDRAVYLSKADLNTAMVMEFTSLQGKMGRIYALRDGEPAAVADALENQYRPRFHGDEVPSDIVSIVLSVSEKLDNIMGSYSVGNIPKGSQDPYALRRQANAVVEMLIRNRIRLQLDTVLKAIAPNYREGLSLVPKVLEFINARAVTIFSDAGMRHDAIESCLTTGCYDYCDLFDRARTLAAFRTRAGFSDMLLGFKRMNNIYASFISKNAGYALNLNAGALTGDAEKQLHAFFSSRSKGIAEAMESGAYESLFTILTEARPVIDAFFDSVMVMDKDIAVRDNRLALLQWILGLFAGLMDFSKISDQ